MVATGRRITNAIGKKIGELRKARGLSREQLSWEAGLNRGYVGFIERGDKKPSIISLAKIAKVLNVTLDELFRKP